MRKWQGCESLPFFHYFFLEELRFSKKFPYIYGSGKRDHKKQKGENENV